MIKSVKEIILSADNLLLAILMKWEKIAGKSNKAIMMPVQLKGGTLVIAVPNNVVLSCAFRFKNQIIQNANKEMQRTVVSEVKFVFAPEKFKNGSEKVPIEEEKAQEISLSNEEIASKVKEFSEEFNVSKPLAFSLAKLALLMQKSSTHEK